MSFLVLSPNDHTVLCFLCSINSRYFKYTTNQDIYDQYKSYFDNSALKGTKRLSYKVFTNSLNSLTREKLIHQNKSGKNNTQSTMIVVKQGVYYGIITHNIELNDQKQFLYNLWNLEQELIVKNPCEILTSLPSGTHVSFYTEFDTAIGNKIFLLGSSQVCVIESENKDINKLSKSINQRFQPLYQLNI
ncbi:MAG: hypothetical protein FJX70_07550 [Alphaproteobacteria bacterium]|nr:hypothetical protein [Alphaproteobacteria bacterium]